MTENNETTKQTLERKTALPLEEIRSAVGKVKYGIVQLVIQDGRVVQIDVTEKRRLV